MSRETLFRDLQCRTGEAFERDRALERVMARRVLDPPRVGEIFLFAESRGHALAWVVIAGSTGECLLVVPADTNPLLGSADVAVPADQPGGPLSLRCAFGLWLTADRFDPRLRTSSLTEQLANEAYETYLAIDAGRVVGSEPQREVDDDPEYREWQRLLAHARESLSMASTKIPAPSSIEAAMPGCRDRVPP